MHKELRMFWNRVWLEWNQGKEIKKRQDPMSGRHPAATQTTNEYLTIA